MTSQAWLTPADWRHEHSDTGLWWHYMLVPFVHCTLLTTDRLFVLTMHSGVAWCGVAWRGVARRADR
jgi:hypothetical protein